MLDAFVWRPEPWIPGTRGGQGRLRRPALVPAPGRVRFPPRKRMGGRERRRFATTTVSRADATLMTETMRGIMRGETQIGRSLEHYTPIHAAHRDGRADDGGIRGRKRSSRALRPRLRDGEIATSTPSVTSSIEYAIDWRLHRVVKRDLDTGTARRHSTTGPGLIAEEHVFVPRRDPTKRGRRLADRRLPRLRARTDRRCTVFDATRVADGPMARAWLDYPLPLALPRAFHPGLRLPVAGVLRESRRRRTARRIHRNGRGPRSCPGARTPAHRRPPHTSSPRSSPEIGTDTHELRDADLTVFANGTVERGRYRSFRGALDTSRSRSIDPRWVKMTPARPDSLFALRNQSSPRPRFVNR